MRKRLSALFAVLMTLSLLFGISASANPAVVSYGNSYSQTLTNGGYVYILPNAKTSGTSIHIAASSANTLRLHYYWSINNTSIDLGTAVVNSTNYNGGSGYYSAGTLVTVVERIPETIAAYPSVSYTISFN